LRENLRAEHMSAKKAKKGVITSATKSALDIEGKEKTTTNQGSKKGPCGKKQLELVNNLRLYAGKAQKEKAREPSMESN